MQEITLKSGRKIPQFGLGTWELTGETGIETVAQALSMGYNHVDTAVQYGNHKEVGTGIKKSGVDRESIYLTTKIPKEKLRRSQILELGQKMLDELAVDYVDLLLVHWPSKKVPFSETFGAFNELVKKGFVKDIGVSNFNAEIMMESVEVSEAPIVTNQVEFHPFLYQKELLKKCKSLGVTLTAYCPLAKGKVFENRILQDIASKYHATIAQVSIAWILSKGIIAIPKATGKDHLKDNLEALSLKLSAEDLERIDSIDQTSRLIDGPWKDFDF
ncbi:MAG: aldo/keto reductase [Chitinispirillaceae bacterium]